MAKVDYIAILFGGKVIKTLKFNLVMYFIAIHVCLVYMSSLQIKNISTLKMNTSNYSCIVIIHIARCIGTWRKGGPVQGSRNHGCKRATGPYVLTRGPFLCNYEPWHLTFILVDCRKW